jgi:hypothetical protein
MTRPYETKASTKNHTVSGLKNCLGRSKKIAAISRAAAGNVARMAAFRMIIYITSLKPKTLLF